MSEGSKPGGRFKGRNSFSNVQSITISNTKFNLVLNKRNRTRRELAGSGKARGLRSVQRGTGERPLTESGQVPFPAIGLAWPKKSGPLTSSSRNINIIAGQAVEGLEFKRQLAWSCQRFKL